MRGVLNRAARLLLTAGVLGLTRPAAAQEIVLPPISTVPPAQATPAPRRDGPLGLPRMLPPAVTLPDPVQPTASPRPAQNAQAAPDVRATVKPHSAVFATDQVKAAVDLLAVPSVPSAWAVDAGKPSEITSKKTTETQPAVLAASSLPTRVESDATGKSVPGPMNLSPLVPHQATEIVQAPPLTQVPAPVPDESRATAPKPVATRATATWAAQRKAPPLKSNEWPAAFVENEPQPLVPLKPVPVKDAEKDEAPATAEFKGPITASVLHQKAARACGGLAKDVRIIVRPDRSFTVQILPVNQSAERELINRLLRIPEMTVPSVHLEVDMMP